MHPLLQRQQLHYQIFIIEQVRRAFGYIIWKLQQPVREKFMASWPRHYLILSFVISFVCAKPNEEKIMQKKKKIAPTRNVLVPSQKEKY